MWQAFGGGPRLGATPSSDCADHTGRRGAAAVEMASKLGDMLAFHG